LTRPGAIVAAALCLLAGGGAHAATVDPALPHYEPRAVEVSRDASYVSPEGAVVVVGYNDMREILEPLAARFSATHPGARFALDLRGTRFAPAALAAGASAFAPMGAELTPAQLARYREKTGADPIGFRVAHASLDPRALSGPLAILVHRDNPLRSITLEQAARVFAGEAVRWGDLGLEGEWAARPIKAYGMNPDTALAYAFQDAAMGARAFGAQVMGVPQSAEVAQKVGAEPLAIGFAAAMRATPEARVLPIAARAGDPPVAPTEESIAAGRYPLDRHLLVFASRPINPIAREFLRLLLSREGQEAIAASPQGYLPLSAEDAARERSRLEGAE
jgi:phosphate transport system substrate-binding protein